MMRTTFGALSILVVVGFQSGAAAQVILNEDEIAQALSFGPWPPEFEADPSNRVSGVPAAIDLGAKLFHDPNLSKNGSLSCSTCHDPVYGFSERKPRSFGAALLDRNTPSVLNVSQHRWFGWDGGSDNLWAQSMLPILNPDEMGHTLESLHAYLQQAELAKDYDAVFGPLSEHRSQDTAVNVGKALAAYQETLMTGATPFDAFRDALAIGDFSGAVNFPPSAQRGLQIFLGRGNCAVCHSGPAFTNGEFHDAGVPYFLEETRVDTGRYGGLNTLLETPYTLAGVYSDDPEARGAWAVRQVRRLHSDFGSFRVPGLRGIAHTAPYMHNGSLANLNAVVAHYNEIDLERLHADGEAILAPLSLSQRDIDDLIQFLLSLSN